MKNSTIILFLAVPLLATLSFAQTTTPGLVPRISPANAKPRVMDFAAMSNMLSKTGGTIYSNAGGPSIQILNTQARIPTKSFDGVASYLQRILRFPCDIREQITHEPINAALYALKDTNTAAVIVIGDAPGYPPLLLAPESRWAFVNIEALSSSSVSNEVFTERCLKETWRALGYLMGAGHSTGEGCVLKPVFSFEDLDAIKAQRIGPEAFMKITANAVKLGIKPGRISTYRKAVEEGWAPPPTNDVQKAIWDEFKK